MSGICDTCKRKPCPAECEGLRRCDFYKGGETRWERLFGTSERAARMITHNTPSTCDDCMLIDICDIGMPTCILRDYDALLEWLRGDAE